jgi:uncharacterized protein (TIGR03435 family)
MNGLPILIGLVCALQIRAHSQEETAPAFEVAFVKLHKADRQPAIDASVSSAGRFVSTGIPLRFLIAIAYNVGFQSVRLSGGPGWINSIDCVYDIEATASPGALPGRINQ